MFSRRQTDTLADVYALNATARAARRLCTDVIRQTSAKPYYGKRGGAAFYAPHDESDAQRKRLAEAVELLSRAKELLYEAAVSGGVVEAHLREISRDDCHRYDGQVVTIDDDDKTASNSEKITLQK